MKKRSLLMLIFGIISLCFAVVDIVLLCVHGGNIFAVGLPFFLCMLGFGLCMAVACFLFLTGTKEEKTSKICPKCGQLCEESSAFCPACGEKFKKIEN